MYFVYHPHHKAIIVTEEEYPKYLADGWYKTPADFPSSIAGIATPTVEEKSPIEEAPKRKGRPPKAKAEDENASVEI